MCLVLQHAIPNLLLTLTISYSMLLVDLEWYISYVCSANAGKCAKQIMLSSIGTLTNAISEVS